MAFNIGEILTHRMRYSTEKEAMKHHERSISYKEYNEQANAFANYLKSIGLRKGDKYVLLYKNHENMGICLFGAAKIGVITVIMNCRLHVNEMQYIVGHSDAKLLVYDDEFSEQAKILMGLENVSYSLSKKTSPSIDEVLSIESDEPIFETFEDEPILMMYTSGTTGLPKGTLISHNNLLASSIALTYTVEWSIHDRFIAVAPFFHIAGVIGIVTAAHIGCTLLMMGDFDVYEFWRILEEEKATTGMVVPTMLEALMKVFEEVQPNVTSLKNFTSGASVVPPKLIELCNEKGVTIQQTYGITEYTGPIAFWVQAQHPGKHNSMGKPVVHCGIAIRDVITGEVVQSGTVGEIVVSGPQVFIGYYKNPEAYADTVRDGALYTGDLGYFDSEGFLYVIDRKKDLIVSGGENIYSAEIELLLQRHPKIEDVAVIAKPEKVWGEIPFAIIVLKKGEQLTLEEVVAYCKANLAPFKAIKEIDIVESLPRNAVGKILKHKLRETYN